MIRHLEAFLRVCIITAMLSSSIAMAQTSYFEVGYQAYLRNQLKLAEGYFTKALGASKTKSDSAYILKFIGITRYMGGNIQGAKEVLAQGYIYDNSLMIYEEEVLDTSVITFYEDVRRRVQDILRQKQMRSNVAAKPSTNPSKNRRQEMTKKSPILTNKTPTKRQIQSDSLSWKDFLPMGINHASRKKYLPAALASSAQLVSLYLYYKYGEDIATEKKENESAKQSLTGEELDAFLEKNNAYIKSLENYQNISAISFPLLWGASIAYAILDTNTTLKAKQRGKRRLPPRYRFSKIDPRQWRKHQAPELNMGLFPSAKGPLVYLSMDLP